MKLYNAPRNSLLRKCRSLLVGMAVFMLSCQSGVALAQEVSVNITLTQETVDIILAWRCQNGFPCNVPASRPSMLKEVSEEVSEKADTFRRRERYRLATESEIIAVINEAASYVRPMKK